MGTRRTRRIPDDPALRLRDEQLESFRAIVGRLAHDFNNFLAPQFGYITLLKDEIPAGSSASSYAAAMEHSGQRAEAYIASILAGMRPQRQFAPREFAFDEALKEALERWSAETAATGQVRLLSDLEAFRFFGDEKQWNLVFEHLLANARFALAIGGELEVTLRRQNLNGDEVLRLGLLSDDVFCLRFRDSGFGMSPEISQRAFEPFFTTRTQTKALGLGLTIVHSVAQFHGAQVELATAEDQGTTVTLWIPARLETPIERPASILLPGALKRAKKVLLIVEDPLVKEVLRSWLIAHELDVETAASEKDARRVLDRAAAQCSLVISEADLQHGKGEELYAALSEINPMLPWVFLAGERIPEIHPFSGREEPLIMKKPFSHRAFSDVVRKYARR